MVEKREYIKTDSNGTEYYRVTAPCSRCGGHGIYYVGNLNGKPVRANPDEGVCYRCGGSGIETYIDKVYTPEHRAELDRQREKRAEKERALRIERENAETLKNFCFDSRDTVYAVLGNTYEIKEQIKSAGGRYNQAYGWFFLEDTDEFDTVAIHRDDILYTNEFGIIRPLDNAYDIIKDIKQRATRVDSNSSWKYNVGDKVDIIACLNNCCGFDSQFGVMYIYRFVDADGNVYIWKTSNYIADLEKKNVNIRGTVKDNSEYKGEKQTVLTRCKISEVN